MSERYPWEPVHWYEPHNDHLREPDVDWIGSDCNGVVTTPYGGSQWAPEATESLEDWAANDDDEIVLDNGMRPVN